MIEEKLDRLATAIEALVITLADNQLKAEAAKRASEPVKTPTPKSKPEAKPEPEKITVADLTELCLAKVRENRDNKDKIKDIIKSYGGELIKDVDEANYPALKAELEVL